MIVRSRRWWWVACGLWLGTMAAAQAQPSTWYAERPGPYVLLAGGGGQYDYDCGRSGYYYSSYYDSCASAGSSAGKAALGFRFGRFGVEGVWTDFGRARINGAARDSLRMQSLGINAVFSLPFGPASEGLLRVGLADVRHSRSDDLGGAEHVFNASAGVAMLLHLGPTVALEVGLDGTFAQGVYTGTASANAFTVGLRLSF